MKSIHSEDGMPSAEWLLVAAVLLDGVLGDPQGWPHPVRLIGQGALALENPCRRLFGNGRAAGLVAVVVVLALTGLAVAAVLQAAAMFGPWLVAALSVYFLYAGLALRDLLAHSRRVHAALDAGDLPEARRRVAMIVGRDTENLDEEGVARACIESVAENMVDGITAPLFYAVIGGPVGIMLYKAVNTMDSTFGYKNDRYRHFGWAAARLDDLANFLPARLSGIVVVLAAPLCGCSMAHAWRIFRRDRLRHASPNSGHTEAAVAGALEVQLGGDGVYFGQTVRKPLLGESRRPLAVERIVVTNRLVLFSAGLLFVVGLIALRVAGSGLWWCVRSAA